MNKKEAFYEIGTARVDITPPLTVPYLSWNPRHAEFHAVHDRLTARVAVISDGVRQAVIINTDTIGLAAGIRGGEEDFNTVIRRKIAAAAGIPIEAILLSAAHIHSSPDTLGFRPLDVLPEAVGWMDELAEKIVGAVLRAGQNKWKARLTIGTAAVRGMARNRRGDDCLDEEATVLWFHSPDAGQSAAIVQFACHPVIVQVQDQISADYVGALRDNLLAGVPGMDECLFLQGACGDIDPAVGSTKNFEDAQRMGAVIAAEAVRLCGIMAADGYPGEAVTLAALSRRILLPSRPLPPADECRELCAQMEKHYNMGTPLPPELVEKEELYYRIREGGDDYPTELQMIQIGGAVLVGIPGEVFCRMGLEIKARAKPLTGVPVGYANGYLGYIAPPEAWTRGGYEVRPGPWSKVGPEGYGLISRALEVMFGELSPNEAGKG